MTDLRGLLEPLGRLAGDDGQLVGGGLLGPPHRGDAVEHRP